MTSKAELEAENAELKAQLEEMGGPEPKAETARQWLDAAEECVRECIAVAREENKHNTLDDQYVLGALSRLRNQI